MLMSYASELGLTGTIALCVQTRDTGVGAVMRSIVAAADAEDAADRDTDENDEAMQVTATDNEIVDNPDDGFVRCSTVQNGPAAPALLDRAMVARRVIKEGRGLMVVEHSELLDFVTKAGCSPEQIAILLPGSTRTTR